MKERILHNWTLLRVLYLIMGGAIIAGSIAQREWLGSLFGAYFASMGVFAYGCAAGNCGVGYRPSTYSKKPSAAVDVDYEEVK